MTTFGKNLTRYRRAAGLTQEALAEALGVSRQAVGKWEAGAAYPEAEKLPPLADMLHCSLDALLRGAEEPESAAEPEDGAREENARAEEETTAFIDRGSSRAYWLARHFILLADVCRAEGRKAEARGYLQGLRETYGEREDDIADRIDQALQRLE